MRRRTGGIHECRVALQFLEHLLVFLVRRHAGHAEGDDLDAPQVAPLLGEDLVQGVGQLQRVAGQLGVADAIFADLGEGGLKGGQQLRFQLAVQPVAGVVLTDVAADIGVEQHGVADTVAVLAEAADAHIDVDTGALIHHPERDGGRCAVFVADQLLGVEIIDALILGRFAAEGEAVGHVVEYVFDAFAQVAHEQGGLGGLVVGVLAGGGAHVHDLALIHDEHTLAVGHRDDRAVGDDVLVTLGVAGALGGLLLTLYRQYVFRNGLAVEVFLPLIRHHAAEAAQCRFNKSHSL